MKHRAGLVVAFMVLAASRVAAEPTNPCTPSEPCHLRMREDTTLTKDNGEQYRLPPGHYYDDPTWEMLDDELKRLQNQETRLTAENESLKKSFEETWKPGWATIFAALLVGAGGGISGYYWYQSR